MKNTFGKEWKPYQKMIDLKLISQIDTINLDLSYKNGFANEITQRAKGNIESPVIETLLMFNPKYQKSPILEFSDGFKKRLSSKDNPKAKGVDFHIDIPQSWKVKKGKRPNIIWLLSDNNGYLDEDNSQVSLGVIVRKLPEKIDTISSQEAQEFCNEALNDTLIKECLKTTLENLPTIYARNTMTLKRLRLTTTIEVANYFVFYKDRVILLQGMVNNINNTLSQKQLNNKFEKYLPLFDQVANSLVINDIYAEKNNDTNNYYTYKLFDDKFQAIFPDTPNIQKIPKELLNPNYLLKSFPAEYLKNLTQKQIDRIVIDTITKMKNSQPYVYTDSVNQISFTTQSMPSGLEHKNYIWSGMKKQLDDLIKVGLKSDNRKLISFSSTLDKKKDTYIAIYTSSYFMDGQKIYSSTKQIYYKDKMYKWTMLYVDKSDKTIFDQYQHHAKMIK